MIRAAGFPEELKELRKRRLGGSFRQQFEFGWNPRYRRHHQVLCLLCCSRDLFLISSTCALPIVASVDEHLVCDIYLRWVFIGEKPT